MKDNNQRKKPHLLVFFSFNTSLSSWKDSGLFERETKLYKSLVESGINVTFITYGDSNDYKFSKDLGGITIFPVFSVIKRKNSNQVNNIHRICDIFKNYSWS